MDVEREIARRIGERGRITFAEFMEASLYWPKGGYYSLPHVSGHTGDYYTAPSAHPAFGALLCLQVFQMWRLLDSPETFWLVEMGAGGGTLCHDLVAYSAHLPHEFRRSLRYLCLDRTARAGIETQLPCDAPSNVQRLAARGVPLDGIEGCLLSNELVDSFSVHRVAVQGGALREVYVTLEDGNLAEVLDTPSTPELERRLDALGVCLPEGYSTEINLALEPWMADVCRAMKRGFHLVIDYGHPAEELYSQRRSRGTLTCFYRHVQTDDPYHHVGRQDMTAQVDFTSLIELGREHGLETLGFISQREYLLNMGLDRFIGRLPGMGLTHREVEANRMGMLDIVRPGGMGEFKVLAQGKAVGTPSLWGYGPFGELHALLEGLPVPLLAPHHIPLLEGRYPHAGVGWETWWPTGREDPGE